MMARRTDEDGGDTGFIAGLPHYTLADLQLYCTAEFFANPKVNRAKLTPSFSPRDTDYGPWLKEWHARMHAIVEDLGV